jgi:hypothetical protein
MQFCPRGGVVDDGMHESSLVHATHFGFGFIW